ncbi:MAG: hypothetical protein P1U74_11480 [Legionellaceae bacterium]|nr:hypothetical protein [Legionellaceae bacterium]
MSNETDKLGIKWQNKPILEYRNLPVVKRYCKERNKSLDFGNDTFVQLMRWYYIAPYFKENRLRMFIIPEIKEIDYMWHFFLIFTRDYSDFCDKFVGHFLHHQPYGPGTSPNEGAKHEFRKQLAQILIHEFDEQTRIDWLDDKKYQ